MKAKQWYQSKQVWFGIAWAVLSVLMVILNFYGYATFTPSTDLVAVIGLLNGVIIIILRYISKQPLA